MLSCCHPLPILCSLQYPIFQQKPIVPSFALLPPTLQPLPSIPQGIHLTSRLAPQPPTPPHPDLAILILSPSRKHRPRHSPLRNRRQRSGGHRLRLQHALDSTVKHALAYIIGRIARRSMARPGEDHLSRFLLHVVMMADGLPVDEVGIRALWRVRADRLAWPFQV